MNNNNALIVLKMSKLVDALVVWVKVKKIFLYTKISKKNKENILECGAYCADESLKK